MKLSDYCAILNIAKESGWPSFGGYCGQAALIINDCFFDGQAVLAGSFNKALAEKGYFIGHVYCKIVEDGITHILDGDGRLKTLDDVICWGELDADDPDYIELFDEYAIARTIENFETSVEIVLTADQIRDTFNCTTYSMYRDHLQNFIEMYFNIIV